MVSSTCPTRTGALEVTTLGDADALQSEAIAAGDWDVPGATWAWHISVGPSAGLKELRRHLSELVLTCERLGVATPDEIGLVGNAAFDWYSNSDVQMYGVAESKRHGAIDVLPQAFGGAAADDLDGLPTWLRDDCFTTDLISSKLAKLAATGRAEQHLFIRVHQTGMPFGLFHPLCVNDVVPTTTLVAPAGLTGLWLVGRWASTLVRWDAAIGWRREQLAA